MIDYKDAAAGKMVTKEDGSGHFTEVILHPQVTISRESDQSKATEIHKNAHELCFIANSVNFPVRCEPIVIVVEKAAGV